MSQSDHVTGMISGSRSKRNSMRTRLSLTLNVCSICSCTSTRCLWMICAIMHVTSWRSRRVWLKLRGFGRRILKLTWISRRRSPGIPLRTTLRSTPLITFWHWWKSIPRPWQVTNPRHTTSNSTIRSTFGSPTSPASPKPLNSCCKSKASGSTWSRSSRDSPS